MDTAWTSDGQVAAAAAPEQDTREVENAVAGPSRMTKRRRIKASKPFVSARYKPDSYDGVFRVVLITSGSVASVKLPLIVGALCKVGPEGYSPGERRNAAPDVSFRTTISTCKSSRRRLRGIFTHKLKSMKRSERLHRRV